MAERVAGTKDLTVLATPAYVATMLAESIYLRRRRQRFGPGAADYETKDTLASLAMGQLSLVAPFIVPKMLRRITPGRTRAGRVVVALAAGAFVTTVVADVVALRAQRRALRELDAPDGDPTTSLVEMDRARHVAGTTAVAAIALGGVATASWWGSNMTATNFQRRAILPDAGTGPLALAAALVGWDFIYYWNHRFMHSSRYMWAMHVVHHSSEHYNLSTALRQPVAESLTTPIPYSALCLLGLRPETVATARGVNLLWQYWIHTESIDSIGPVELVLNSPSAHRVHHGSNRRYLDRNHGGILIIWDRLFGTFEPENERVVYGLTTNIHSYNPAVIIGHEYAAMARDIAAASTWRDRLGHLVRAPGWRREVVSISPASRGGSELVPGAAVAPTVEAHNP